MEKKTIVSMQSIFERFIFFAKWQMSVPRHKITFIKEKFILKKVDKKEDKK